MFTTLVKQSNRKYDPSTQGDRRITRGAGRPRPKELNHLFVNNVRFWCMLSIVAMHAVQAVLLVPSHAQLGILLTTPFKFATIGFFLISGFLLGERVDRRDPVDYFMRRVKKVFIPWSLWFCLMSLTIGVEETAPVHGPHTWPPLSIVYWAARSTLMNTSFWFVPNLLFSIAILLIFRRHLYSLRFGAVLLAANLVYVVNIYTLWFSARHTQAIFGFVFYLWLGSYIAHNFERISAWLARIPTAVCATLALVTGAASYGETRLLFALHKPDALSTLRFTTQMFSLCMVLWIFKFSRATWPSFIDVRRHTFGIYLAHSIVMQVLARLEIFATWRTGSVYQADAEGILLWIVLSVATYSWCLVITSWLANQSLFQWTVGLAPDEALRLQNAQPGIANGVC
ncbi:MAG: acyltransferase [Acidobacteriota bacterium]|nr:acyltransferase [Acidobacteriota bacterium]